MGYSRASYEASVVSEPKGGGVAKPPEEAFDQISEKEKILYGEPSREDPFSQGNGPIDVVCGECGWTAMEEMNSGQVETLSFECPVCDSWNFVLAIPALENFIHELQSSSPSAEDMDQFRDMLDELRESPNPSEELATRLESELPEFSWAKDLVRGADPTHVYGMISILVSLVGVYLQLVLHERTTVEPPSVVEKYLMEDDL